VATLAVDAIAEDITSKKMSIKDHPDPAKRQVQAFSADAGVVYAEADDPATNGASVHVYSATDDFCYVLTAGAAWSTNGKVWKYKNAVNKNQAQIGDRKLQVKLRSGVKYTLADDGTQGTVNVQVQFGPGGTRYCMRCTGNSRDDAGKFMGKTCAAAACDGEPSICNPTATTTTTTTTMPPAVLRGALNPTSGKFDYNLTPGIPGADAACNTIFAGTHACSYSELQAAEAAGNLVGLKDINNNNVSSFWAIDGSHADTLQCYDTLTMTRWAYQTAHTGHFAEKVNLTNGTGTLGPLLSGSPDGALCLGSSWVGCCQ
jgi:hypothetical protein